MPLRRTPRRWARRRRRSGPPAPGPRARPHARRRRRPSANSSGPASGRSSRRPHRSRASATSGVRTPHTLTITTPSPREPPRPSRCTRSPGDRARMSTSPTSTASAPSSHQARHVVRAAHPRFSDADHVVGDRLAHPSEGGEIGGERLQVAVVDADARLRRRRRHSRLVDVVDLDDCLRAAARHPREALIERIGVEHRHDQEHPVRTGHARLRDLHGVEREVLAQQRDIDCSRAPVRDRRASLRNPGPSVSTEIAATPHVA